MIGSRYELSDADSGTRVQLIDYGATVTNIWCVDRNGNGGDVLLDARPLKTTLNLILTSTASSVGTRIASPTRSLNLMGFSTNSKPISLQISYTVETAGSRIVYGRELKSKTRLGLS